MNNKFDDDEIERLKRILKTMNRWTIIREFKLSNLMGKPLLDEFQKIFMMMGELDERPFKIKMNPISTIKFSYDIKNEEFTLYEIIEESISLDIDENIDELTNLVGDNNLYKLRGIRKELTHSHKYFSNDIISWRLKFNDSSFVPFEPNEIEKHLSGILWGYHMLDLIEYDNRDKIKESILRQLSTYIRTGSLDFVDKEKINLEKMDYPEPMVFLSDYKDSLVWKHKKYCPKCGKVSSDMCYCTDINKKITDNIILDKYPCWNCYQEAIERGFQQNYNDEFDEETCEELMNLYLTPFLECEENFEFLDIKRGDVVDDDWNFKKIEDEGIIQNLIDEINRYYAEVGVVDGAGTCSCPNW